MNSIQELIANIYIEHDYLLENLTTPESDIFRSIQKRDNSVIYLQEALKRLSALLVRHHGIKCLVLVDRFDTPGEIAFRNGYYKMALDFFRSLFQLLLRVCISTEVSFLVACLLYYTNSNSCFFEEK